MNPESIYIHIPFCKTKCPYCDFASWAKKEHLFEEYIDALISEIKTKCEAYFAMGNLPQPIHSLFIGGGTPSLIPPDLYEKLFSELKKHFQFLNDCEITMELNPGTANDNFLVGYKKLGVNRISIGAQSFNEKILETLGRKHSVDETIEAIEKIKNAGFTNFNLDFIFSVPGMTKQIWEESIYKALSFNPKHISSYSLIIEPGTPFEHIYKDPKNLPTDDTASEFYMLLCQTLNENGYKHYEVSNFAKSGFESKHNLNYWLAKEYYAFGVGAHRYLNGLRTANTKDLDLYISNPNIETIVDFPINYDFEKIMLTSRLNQGFSLKSIERVTTKDKHYVKNMLNTLTEGGFIELFEDNVHLTDKGMFVNNEILLKLI
jgi:oxygen-independent coproporphyrinogen-3 oxidase